MKKISGDYQKSNNNKNNNTTNNNNVPNIFPALRNIETISTAQ